MKAWAISMTQNSLLSRAIADHSANPSSSSFALFLEQFRRSNLGVIIPNPPTTNGPFVATSSQPVSVGLTKYAGGRPMVLAFADPPVFAQNFGCPFNAEMYGEALLNTVMYNPDCQGILVNSALAAISAVIDRPTVESLLARVNSDKTVAKRWWRFW